MLCGLGKGSSAGPAVWLKCLLSSHTGYIMSLPDSQQLLSPLLSALEDRTKNYNSVFQLVGKLDMLDKQIKQKTDDKADREEKEPIVLYQDDSSDELENVIDDLLVPGSDSGEEDWPDEDEDDNEMSAADSDDSIEIVKDANSDMVCSD